jgi:hypothetical protein
MKYSLKNLKTFKDFLTLLAVASRVRLSSLFHTIQRLFKDLKDLHSNLQTFKDFKDHYEPCVTAVREAFATKWKHEEKSCSDTLAIVHDSYNNVVEIGSSSISTIVATG